MLIAPSPIEATRPDNIAPAAVVSGRATSRTRQLVTALLIALAAGGTVAWYVLWRWYGLFEHRDHAYYSFEKVVDGFDSPMLRQTLGLFVGISIAYAIAIVILSRTQSLSTFAKLGLVAMAAGPAIVNVLLFPVGALDVFNYMTELKLAFYYDRNPYLHTFEPYLGDSFANSAFLTNVTLFYGPAWLLITGIPAAIAGFDDQLRTLIALKVFNLLLIGGTAGAIAWYQRDSRQRWLAAILFAANPLVLFEGIGNGHNDVLLSVFVVTAMLALERKSPLAGPLLALSALVKLYTVALAPIFIVVAIRQGWGWKRISLTVVLTAAAVAATCAPYWGEGKLVDGSRAGLEESQEMDHVSPLSLVRQYAQQEEAAQRPDPEFALSRPSFEIVPQDIQDDISRDFTIAFVIGALLIAATVWKGHPPELAAAETLLLLFLLMTNLYGWYLIPVFALLALHPDRLSRWYVMIASALGLAYYPMFVYVHYNSGWPRFERHQFLALFLTLPIILYLVARTIPWQRIANRWRARRTAEVAPA